jgi:dihydrofolate synthase/folylpolyglutamate synthase
VAKIAAVKAGIIKEGCPVFSAPQEPSAAEVLKSVSREKNAKLLLLEDSARLVSQEPGRLCMEYQSKAYGTLRLETKLAGTYQLRNAALAAETALALLPELISKMNERESDAKTDADTPGNRMQNQLVPSNEDLCSIVQQGIAEAAWPGRFEVIGRDPLFVIDGAHNEDAAKSLARTIQNCFTNTSLTYIIGVLADKEHEKMLRTLLPYADMVYTVTPDNPRALDARALAKEAEKFHGNVTCCASVQEAVSQALSHAKEAGTPILAFGSLSYLNDLKQAYGENTHDR